MKEFTEQAMEKIKIMESKVEAYNDLIEIIGEDWQEFTKDWKEKDWEDYINIVIKARKDADRIIQESKERAREIIRKEREE